MVAHGIPNLSLHGWPQKILTHPRTWADKPQKPRPPRMKHSVAKGTIEIMLATGAALIASRRAFILEARFRDDEV
jgi:hypothetical protein